jgi:YVTN family beta-propeller protein
VGSLGNSPQDVAFDSRDSQIYVTNEGSGTVLVVNVTANSIGTFSLITVGANPYSDVFDSQNDEIFVTNHASSTVSVISG